MKCREGKGSRNDDGKVGEKTYCELKKMVKRETFESESSTRSLQVNLICMQALVCSAASRLCQLKDAMKETEMLEEEKWEKSVSFNFNLKKKTNTARLFMKIIIEKDINTCV